MELKAFFKLLGKYKNILIVVPLITVIISFFLVRNLEDEYISISQISTGIVDETRQLLDPTIATLQESRISGQFNNLIEVMKLKKMTDMVSYQLIIHDLSAKTPFRRLPKPFDGMKPEARQQAIDFYKEKLARLEPLSLIDTYQKQLNDLLIAMHYDERSLRKVFTIYHEDYSDFITIKASTENPYLSAFMVNTLTEGFIAYQTRMVKLNETSAVNYLATLVKERRQALDSATNRLQRYKIANDVLNLEDQSKSTNEQIATNQDKLVQAQKDMSSYRGALNNVERKLGPQERAYIERNLSRANSAIVNTQDQLHNTIDRYVRSGFDPKVKKSMDSLARAQVGQLANSADIALNDPQTAKMELVRQRNELSVNYDLARYSVDAILDQLQQLKGNFKRLVPLDATVKTLQFQIDVTAKEYQDVLNRYNTANMQYRTENKLIQIEKANPDIAQPSKKMLLVIISAIGSLVLCVVILFVIFFLDDTIKDPVHLANKTQLPVLGYLNLISGPSIDLRKLWDVEHRDKMQQFKDLLRAIRFEIDQELRGEKVLSITSMKEGEGKTLLAISLAYSYSMINKKVLLIDGNFENPTISRTVNPKVFIEEYFKNSPQNTESLSASNSVLGNHGGDITLLEIGDEQFIAGKLAELKQTYDIIIIETPPLDAMNKSKEWMLFSSKTVAVFAAGQDIVNGKKQLVKYLGELEGKFAGWVLNKSLYGQRKRSRK